MIACKDGDQNSSCIQSHTCVKCSCTLICLTHGVAKDRRIHQIIRKSNLFPVELFMMITMVVMMTEM